MGQIAVPNGRKREAEETRYGKQKTGGDKNQEETLTGKKGIRKLRGVRGSDGDGD